MSPAGYRPSNTLLSSLQWTAATTTSPPPDKAKDFPSQSANQRKKSERKKFLCLDFCVISFVSVDCADRSRVVIVFAELFSLENFFCVCALSRPVKVDLPSVGWLSSFLALCVARLYSAVA